MIKKLKRKFIFITMISVFAVLFTIMLAINIINYAKMTSDADNILRVLSENGGEFPNFERGRPNETEPMPQENQPAPPQKDDRGRMNEETPFETRFFTVKIAGEQTETNVDNIASVSSEQAVELANKVLSKNKKQGYIEAYRYLVSDDGTFIIFVSCEKNIRTFNDFLISSIGLSAVGLIAVFVLSLFLSEFAIKPMKESYEKQKRFVTDASHELKTPLTIISANNELTELMSGQTTETQNISKQVARMTEMVKNLTMLSRLDEINKLSGKEIFSLDGALTDMTDIFRPSMEVGARTFEVNIGENLKINGDEALLRQAFSILLDNAAKYAKTKIFLSAELSGKNVTVQIQNDADGVEDGDLNVCFERFYRSPIAAASSIGGSGIGLSIAKEIVELNNGKISAEGASGNFIITISFPSYK